MGTIEARYDAAAARYRSWWEPVLGPTALGVLDEVGDGLPDVPRVLDVGTGTGVLAMEAIRRWPAALVTGLDGSNGMLAEAEARRSSELEPTDRDRMELVIGHAARMPFPDARFDLVVSSFVLQLVPIRIAALREMWRVLRPGGRAAFVTWLQADPDDRFAPDEAFEKALDELDIGGEAEPEEARSGDYASAAAAATQLRRAGFRAVRARPGWLVHRYDPETYVDFLAEYAEREVFEDLDPGLRLRLRQRTQARLDRLPARAFEWRVPVVTASGTRPGDDAR